MKPPQVMYGAAGRQVEPGRRPKEATAACSRSVKLAAVKGGGVETRGPEVQGARWVLGQSDDPFELLLLGRTTL